MLSKKLRLLILIAMVGALHTSVAHAQLSTSGGVTVPTLKEQLKFGLQARTPAEQKFIDKVVQMVDDGELSRKLVDSTFLWARRKQPYPMPYFQKALTVRAKQEGVDLNDDLGSSSTF